MSRHWERVRTVVQCAYGHAIGHAEWAWFGRHPFVVCEPCAAKYGIVRPSCAAPDPVLVAASPERSRFTEVAALAAQFQAAPQQVLRKAKTRRTTQR